MLKYSVCKYSVLKYSVCKYSVCKYSVLKYSVLKYSVFTVCYAYWSNSVIQRNIRIILHKIVRVIIIKIWEFLSLLDDYNYSGSY